VLFKSWQLWVVIAALFPGWLRAAPLSVPDLFAQSHQLVLVITPDWQTVTGHLRRFEWREGTWEAVGAPIPIVVGRSGLAWGRGLHPMPQEGPIKKEGDGKSPAGIFRLSYAFGYAAPDAVRDIKLPYRQCTASLECVDDVKSAFYNTVIDRNTLTKPDWNSSEHMRMKNDEYKLGIFVAHNTDPAVLGVGSCVFMHIWLGPGIPTSGCTAMTEGSIESLLGWLDSSAQPLLVQLPQAEFNRLQKPWGLPANP
jgi:D-alanyl-D-alanine dipeptidase